MERPLDLAALAGLPDAVKRRILSALPPPPPPAAAAAGPGPACPPADHVSISSTPLAGRQPQAALAGRQLRLPALSGGACVLDGVLSPSEAEAAAAAVEVWLAAHGRRPGMGSSKSGGAWHAPDQRGDVTSWAGEGELRAAGQALLADLLAMVAALRPQLAAQGYDVSGRCSFQLACYPAGGARYVRHADASPAVPDRTATALLYLNRDWQPQRDGGLLALYNAAHSSCCGSDGDALQQPGGSSGSGSGHLAGEPALLVAPLAGRLLVFDSHLQHEVLPAHRHRYSITAWFYASASATAPATADAAASAAAVAQQLAAVCIADTPPPPPLGTSHQRPRIFVAIASFRDEETQWTLRDLFIRAAHPARVFVGVVWQLDPAADAGFARLAGGERTARFQAQVREVRLHYSSATGPCAARSLAQQLWCGEEFVLQVDAHMRFVEGWDELCLQQLAAAQSAAGHVRVVLSAYPPGYSGDGPAASVPEDAPVTLLCAKGFEADGLLRIHARALRARPPRPLRSLFWAAGFSFAPSAWLTCVPYCPHLPHLFFGEESFMLARMATRGWHVYAPALPLAFHQWERSARAHSYQASGRIDAAARAASQARVLRMLGAAPAAPLVAQQQAAECGDSCAWHAAAPPAEADWAVGGVWGLGTLLSLGAWEHEAGVCFASRSLTAHARNGGQPPDAFVEC